MNMQERKCLENQNGTTKRFRTKYRLTLKKQAVRKNGIIM